MKDAKKLHQYIHYNMSLFGGFLGAYAILNRSELLGNAQTSNLIHLAMDILGGDVVQIFIRIGAMILYSSGIMFTVILTKYTKWNLHIVSVLIDMFAVFLLALMPESMNHVVALYPIFFAMAFQWNIFADICGYVSSTIFSTNNLRQMTISFTKYVCDRQQADLVRGKFYAGVLLYYHIGVGVSYISWKMIGLKGICVGMAPLVSALLLVCYDTGFILSPKRSMEG